MSCGSTKVDNINSGNVDYRQIRFSYRSCPTETCYFFVEPMSVDRNIPTEI
jgi:hypothetical protein